MIIGDSGIAFGGTDTGSYVNLHSIKLAKVMVVVSLLLIVDLQKQEDFGLMG